MGDMASYRSVDRKRLHVIIGRLQKGTVAQNASRYDFDNQDCHVAYIRKNDHRALSAKSSSSSSSLDDIVGRLTRPTTASVAARHDFDAQECHIEYLKTIDKNYPPPVKVMNSQDELERSCRRLTTDTAASKAAKYDFDAQREHVKYLELIDPKYPGHKKYGFRTKSAPFCKPDDFDFDERVNRWCKPTVASLGGTPLANKDFIYIPPQPSATCPEVKGLETKFKGTKRMSSGQVTESVTRLNRPHKRFMR